MLETGIKNTLSMKVEESSSAKVMGSGTLDVFATPAMAALMEKTAWMSVAPYLEEGMCTVGTRLDLTHDAPTPLGATVTCESVLTEIAGRRLVFALTVTDGENLIGQGQHERFIVSVEKFQEKADSMRSGKS